VTGVTSTTNLYPLKAAITTGFLCLPFIHPADLVVNFRTMRASIVSVILCLNYALIEANSVGGSQNHFFPPTPDRVLMLDVDNSLYSETDAKSRGKGIEEQIIENTYQFCKRFNISREEADVLHREYGSTVEGLRQTMATNRTSEEMNILLEEYYNQVWPESFDYSSLLRNNHETDRSGYSKALSSSVSLNDLLKACPFPIYFTSNSPERHVRAVKEALGLCGIAGTSITPDNINDSSIIFPTKSSPEAFFGAVKRSHPLQRLILLDDSKFNIEKSCWYGVEGIHVRNGDLQESLARAMGHIDRDFILSHSEYLKSKNIVDARSMDMKTWLTLAESLDIDENGQLDISELGCGLMFMLEMIMKGKEDKPALLNLIDGVQKVVYHAFESNLDLFHDCLDKIHELGFTQTPRNEPRQGDVYVFHHLERNIVLHFHWYDYQNAKTHDRGNIPHLIIGCAFADLMDPNVLVKSLHQSFGYNQKRVPLVYFPITFSGTTQFVSPKPFQKSSRGWIPSDTVAFRSYSEILEKSHCHNLNPVTLIEAFTSHGGEILQQGKSNWKIDKELNPYFWKCMLYFFGIVAAPKLMVDGWDSIGWIERSQEFQTGIIVSNADILFRLHSKMPGEVLRQDGEMTKIEIQEIQFTAPYFVETVSKPFDVDRDLLADQVVIKSMYSLISSGTEIKIYSGDFEDAQLDVNIPGLNNERMAYPMAYGYCLVGRISHVGSKVDPNLKDKLVFTFSPHASHVVASVNAIQVLPDDIAPEDAIFMPSVETALSVVHDANIRVGENVAIYGQGLIGLLVASILALQKAPLDSSARACNFGVITTIDTLPERLAMSSALGSSQALFPDEIKHIGPFDVSIELSGNPKALQSAIDHTRNGGRVVIGSWYGNSDVNLKLGIDFHRSHITIKTSQVSEVPAELKTLWSKERRFHLTWELLRIIRPSRLLTKVTTLNSACDAYESLSKGDDIAVAFRYDSK
jgi:threonine dehydrogenase-like Zn-dependent dehydrogenase/beta-phosphoglucomutase-like phosphatase (HAD superfamily)